MGHDERFQTMCYECVNAYAQSDQSLCLSLEYSMTLGLLKKTSFGVSKLKRSCTSLSESTFGKMPHCWKSCLDLYTNIDTNSICLPHRTPDKSVYWKSIFFIS